MEQENTRLPSLMLAELPVVLMVNILVVGSIFARQFMHHSKESGRPVVISHLLIYTQLDDHRGPAVRRLYPRQSDREVGGPNVYPAFGPLCPAPQPRVEHVPEGVAQDTKGEHR